MLVGADIHHRGTNIMGKKLATTPRSRIRSALRMVFLRSREHAAALKRENNTCEHCKRKASVAKGKELKVEVHHRSTKITNWDKIIELVFEELLCHPDFLEVLCKECHVALHAGEEDGD